MCVDTNLHVSHSRMTLVLPGTETRYGYKWVPVPFSREFPICIHPGEQFISFPLIYISFCLGVSLIAIILKYCLSIQKPFDNWLTPRLLVTTNYFTFWALCKSYNKKSLLTSWKKEISNSSFPIDDRISWKTRKKWCHSKWLSVSFPKYSGHAYGLLLRLGQL